MTEDNNVKKIKRWKPISGSWFRASAMTTMNKIQPDAQ
jgi:hypothetical protein